MAARWLIVADDLTGAADCAIAFAKAELATAVSWRNGAERTDDKVAALSVDLDSRGRDVDTACRRHAEAIEALLTPDRALFKKVDSLWRGHPAEEIAATARALEAKGLRRVGLLAPAFPATQRTTVNGRVLLCGKPLEGTPEWGAEHRYPDADLCRALHGAGLRTATLSLARLRAARDRVLENAGELRGAEVDVLVCDAETEADLDQLAAASLADEEGYYWIGTAGLAHALAGASPGTGGSHAIPTVGATGVLVVVGSLATASRSSAERLAQDPTLHHLSVHPAQTSEPSAVAAMMAQAVANLAGGTDVIVELEATPDTDAACGAELAQRFAHLLLPAVRVASALIATGGETAAAVLRSAGTLNLSMVEEVEPGVPLAIAAGDLAIPVITKAGAFGDAGTLERCRRRLHAMRRERIP